MFRDMSKSDDFNISLATTVMHRVDHTQNMARFYVVQIEHSLFGETALIRSWGRLNTRGRVRIDLFGSMGEAEVVRARLVTKKLVRGYRIGSYGKKSSETMLSEEKPVH